MKINKKGFLLGEYTLKVVIAGISLLLLVYLLFSLYSSFINEKNFKRAEATLNSLNEKMINVKNSGNGSIPLLEPNGWRLISYISGEKPEKCSNYCICLCEGIEIKDRMKLIWAPSQKEKCNIRGVCKEIDVSINEFNIGIRNDVYIEFKNRGFSIIANETK